MKRLTFTTIFGALICIMVLIIWPATFFLETRRDINDWYFGIAAISGVGLVILPQRILIEIIKRRLNSKTNE